MMPEYFSDTASQEHGGNHEQHVVELPTTWAKMCPD